MCDKPAQWAVVREGKPSLTACIEHIGYALDYALKEGGPQFSLSRIDLAEKVRCGYSAPSGAIECEFKAEASVVQPKKMIDAKPKIGASAGLSAR